MSIAAPHPEWAEQDPDDWWAAACIATRHLLAKTNVSADQIAAIGITYQMHGLVLLDKHGQLLRPAIIWCDSRAIDTGNQAFEALGESFCLEHYLNSPGNFTASKLRWVQENEPDIFAKVHKFMLPGDYLAYRMTGEMGTTLTGLSEGILWDFKKNTPATDLLAYYQIPESMLPTLEDVFSWQGDLNSQAAADLGLSLGTPITYRAGDQPNNALSLNVLRPGEVAASGGTSGVVYAVSAHPVFDPKQRVNSFAHVNYTPENPLTGVLLCINGAGSLYRWIKENMGGNALTYSEMEQLASAVPIGADGLSILPFGNGSERMLGNQNQGAQIMGLHFNRHGQGHLFRAALEGIAFAFVYGMEALQDLNIPIQTIRVGNDNLFQSAIFAETIASLMGVEIEVYATTGAAGAAKAAGVSVGIYTSPESAMEKGLVSVATIPPSGSNHTSYAEAYNRWRGYFICSKEH